MGSTDSKFLSVIFLLSIFTAGCGRMNSKNGGQKKESLDPDSPQLFMKPVKIQAFGKNGLEWELDSPQAEGYSDRNYIKSSGRLVPKFSGLK